MKELIKRLNSIKMIVYFNMFAVKWRGVRMDLSNIFEPFFCFKDQSVLSLSYFALKENLTPFSLDLMRKWAFLIENCWHCYNFIFLSRTIGQNSTKLEINPPVRMDIQNISKKGQHSSSKVDNSEITLTTFSNSLNQLSSSLAVETSTFKWRNLNFFKWRAKHLSKGIQ